MTTTGRRDTAPAPPGGAPDEPGSPPSDLERLAKDCRFEFYRASGPGGQHRNKTETAVRVIHLPTGLRAQATERRSQSRNRIQALERLAAKLAALSRRRKPRVATRKPGAVRAREAGQKRRIASKKQARRAPVEDD